MIHEAIHRVNEADVSFDERWLRRYLKFINVFSIEKKEKFQHEIHHILPQSIFPQFSNLKINKWNESVLSYRSHYIAHTMLAKAFGGKMWFAWNMMRNSPRTDIKNGSRLFESLRREFSLQVSKNNLGKKRTEDFKKHMSEISVGRPSPMKGRSHTEKSKLQMSNYHKNRPTEVLEKMSLSQKGKVVSEITKEKMSISHTGSKHHFSKHIHVFNRDGEIKFESYGNFKEICDINSLPFDKLKESYQQNGEPIYQSERAKRMISGSKNEIYIGWYALENKI